MYDIVIVGGGPRGTYCLRRLALRLQGVGPLPPVCIHVVEKSGNFGGGGVHSPTQSRLLLLNTVAAQVTAFGDDDPARDLPGHRTLHHYLAHNRWDIGPNDYPARALHGEYLAAMFRWFGTNMPPGVSLALHTTAATDIIPEGDFRRVLLADGSFILARHVLLVTGHARHWLDPDSREWQWHRFATDLQTAGKNRSYTHFAYPIDETSRQVQPGERIYIIGMGLTAVDIVRMLTLGRGGRIEGGRYLPSGREPRILLGSRLGVPYCARAVNQKKDQYKGRMLIPERVLDLRKAKERLDFQRDLLPLVRLELEVVYYTTLMGEAFGDEFLRQPDNDARASFVAARVDPGAVLTWDELVNPLYRLESQRQAGQPLFPSYESYHGFVCHLLRQDIAEAERGNMTSPLKSAVDAVFRDLRDVLRLAVNWGGLTPSSHRWFNGEFDRMNNRIAVGPPLESTRQILMLAEAGLLEFSGPRPRLSTDSAEAVFAVESPEVTGSRRFAEHVINGRIHSVSLRRDSSPLIAALLARGVIRPWVNRLEEDVYEPGGLEVDKAFAVVGADGQADPQIAAIGIPTEGILWFNAADARPDVNSTAISQLDQWAKKVVASLAQEGGGAEHSFVPRNSVHDGPVDTRK